MEGTSVKECMITTFDNPYDYFTQFNDWYRYDTIEKGYNTCAYLARLAVTSDDMTQDEENLAIEKACDRIIELDFLNIYKKIYRK